MKLFKFNLKKITIIGTIVALVSLGCYTTPYAESADEYQKRANGDDSSAMAPGWLNVDLQKTKSFKEKGTMPTSTKRQVEGIDRELGSSLLETSDDVTKPENLQKKISSQDAAAAIAGATVLDDLSATAIGSGTAQYDANGNYVGEIIDGILHVYAGEGGFDAGDSKIGYDSIQDAINFANSRGGGVVHILRGSYNTNLTLTGNIRLYGGYDSSGNRETSGYQWEFMNSTQEDGWARYGTSITGTISVTDATTCEINGVNIDRSSSYSYDDGFALTVSNSNLTLRNSEIRGGHAQNVVNVSLSTLTIEDSIISAYGETSYGETYTLSASDSTVTILHGAVYNERHTAIKLDDSDLTIEDSTVASARYGQSYAYGILREGDSALTLAGDGNDITGTGGESMGYSTYGGELQFTDSTLSPTSDGTADITPYEAARTQEAQISNFTSWLDYKGKSGQSGLSPTVQITIGNTKIDMGMSNVAALMNGLLANKEALEGEIDPALLADIVDKVLEMGVLGEGVSKEDMQKIAQMLADIITNPTEEQKMVLDAMEALLNEAEKLEEETGSDGLKEASDDFAQMVAAALLAQALPNLLEGGEVASINGIFGELGDAKQAMLSKYRASVGEYYDGVIKELAANMTTLQIKDLLSKDITEEELERLPHDRIDKIVNKIKEVKDKTYTEESILKKEAAYNEKYLAPAQEVLEKNMKMLLDNFTQKLFNVIEGAGLVK